MFVKLSQFEHDGCFLGSVLLWGEHFLNVIIICPVQTYGLYLRRATNWHLCRVIGSVMDDNRTEVRRRALKGGQILFNERHSTISCTIKNMSEHGAKLEVASIVGIPDSFDLIVGEGGEARPVRVAWRQSTSLGVEFL